MGQAANQLTSLAGVRLFPGGPYPDAGLGDVQQKQVQQYQNEIAPLIQQIAQAAGVGNPITGSQGQFTTDPYGLQPLDQATVNKQNSEASLESQAILARVKADLASKGLTDSSSMAAAEAYLNQHLMGQQQQNELQMGQYAYQNRNQALQQIGQLIGNMYGAQANVTAGNKQQALEASQTGHQNLASMLGLGLQLGGVIPGSRQPGVGGIPGYNPAGGASTPPIIAPNADAGIPFPTPPLSGNYLNGLPNMYNMAGA